MAGLMRLQSALLLAGSGLWVLVEGYGLFSGGMGGIITRAGSIAFVMIALGLTVLWGDRDADAISRTGIALGVPGMAILALELHLAVDTDARYSSDFSGQPLYLTGLGLAACGALLVAVWIVRKRPYGLNVAVVLGLSVGLAVAATILALPPVVQAGADIAIAVVLAEIAVQAMGRSVWAAT
jgi:uncharacterized membrane protein YidH (DUF202 family)